MVGMFLKDREVQYTANRDEITNTWRILDTWHEDLKSLGPEDEVEDTSKSVTVITEGAFIAIVKEAARLGVLQNANFGENPEFYLSCKYTKKRFFYVFSKSIFSMKRSGFFLYQSTISPGIQKSYLENRASILILF